MAHPRSAVTVALVRDGSRGLETWMMNRPAGMAFAAGASVFPGGRVEPSDGAVRLGDGADGREWAARLGVDDLVAGSLATAALREVVEEAGVLLGEQPTLVDLGARQALEEGRTAFADLLASRSVVPYRRLIPWMRWVTPASERRRYDTWFFVAVLPSSFEVGAPNTEASSAGWVGVADLLASGERGETWLLPPTVVALRALRDAGGAAAVVQAAPRRSMSVVEPQIEHHPDGSVAVSGGGEVVVVTSPRPATAATPST